MNVCSACVTIRVYMCRSNIIFHLLIQSRRRVCLHSPTALPKRAQRLVYILILFLFFFFWFFFLFLTLFLSFSLSSFEELISVFTSPLPSLPFPSLRFDSTHMRREILLLLLLILTEATQILSPFADTSSSSSSSLSMRVCVCVCACCHCPDQETIISIHRTSNK